MNSRRKLILAIVLLLKMDIAVARNNCEVEWERLAGKFRENNAQEVLTEWLGMKNLCGDSSFFELKKGWLEVHQNQFDAANSTFLEGIEKKDEFHPEIELALADFPFQKAARIQGDEYQRLMIDAEEKMIAFINKYPSRADGYGLITGLKIVNGEYEEAIRFAKKSADYGGDAYAFRNAAIASYQLGLDSEAVQYASLAFELVDYKSDVEFMLIAALSYANLHRFDISLGLLKLLDESSKGVKSSQRFQEVVIFIRQQYVEYENSK